MKCPNEDCHWSHLCPDCERRENARAGFIDRMIQDMRKDGRQVCVYGASDGNWNSIEVALYGKRAIIR